MSQRISEKELQERLAHAKTIAEAVRQAEEKSEDGVVAVIDTGLDGRGYVGENWVPAVLEVRPSAPEPPRHVPSIADIGLDPVEQFRGEKPFKMWRRFLRWLKTIVKDDVCIPRREAK